MILDDPLIPGPNVVLLALWEHATDGELFYHLGVTLLRVAAAFTVAMVVGTAIGVIMDAIHSWTRPWTGYWC